MRIANQRKPFAQCARGAHGGRARAGAAAQVDMLTAPAEVWLANLAAAPRSRGSATICHARSENGSNRSVDGA